MSDESTGRKSRGGGRGARRAARTSGEITQLGAIKRAIPELNILTEEALEIIEHNAETILEEIGVRVEENPGAIEVYRAAGCDIDPDTDTSMRVRFPRGLAKSLLATAPSTFIQRARNPERSVEIGGKNTVLAPVYGPPFVRDLEGGRRYGTIEDFQNLVKLIYMSPGLSHSGGTVCEPTDVAVNKRHLDMLYAHMRLSDKPFMGSVTAPERALDTVEMCKILFGEDFVENNVVTVSLINLNSPLVQDPIMMGAMENYISHGQACIVAPFIVGGAMSPVSAAGTLAQAYAEFLAAGAYAQLLRPGTPIIFGTFASSIDMSSGAPTFGTPEASHVIYGMGQLARRLGVPFRSGGSLCGSKLADAQAAYESAATLSSTIYGGVHFSLHAAGWLEGGLVSGYEKLIMDADQCAAMHKLAAGIDMSENGQAMDAVREVGPGGHYLGCAHTQANFQTAFWRTGVLDYKPFEQWSDEGARDTVQLAHAKWKKMLADYQPPEIDPGVDEGLRDYIARKKESMPDAFA